MKLPWCCFLAVLLTAQAAVDVEKTVQQVESILKGNSQLPRLSRQEILQLLNDIRAEDAKNSASKDKSTESTTYLSTQINEMAENSTYLNVDSDNEIQTSGVLSSLTSETSTKSSEPSVMVVLPYTPKDGWSLQELYTKAPRVERVPISKFTSENGQKAAAEKLKLTNEKIKETLNTNAKLANQAKKHDLPQELQEFLDAHGLKGKPGNDNFLLPLDGFKPLPPAKLVDGSVELPENILLTYDLISPGTDTPSESNIPSNNALYEPLQPDYPYDLKTSQSESKETKVPLAMPDKPILLPNYEPIDYDSIKVIPLGQGPKPEDEVVTLNVDLNKRQTENGTSDPGSESTNSTSTDKGSTTAPETDSKAALPSSPDASPAESDSGASITDLEDSFGGAASTEPGDSMLPPQRKNGFYWMLDWNSFLEVGDGDTKVNIRLEPKLGDPQMFLPVSVP